MENKEIEKYLNTLAQNPDMIDNWSDKKLKKLSEILKIENEKLKNENDKLKEKIETMKNELIRKINKK